MELAWSQIEKMLVKTACIHDTVYIIKPQRKKTTQKHLENGPRARNVDSKLQVR